MKIKATDGGFQYNEALKILMYINCTDRLGTKMDAKINEIKKPLK